MTRNKRLLLLPIAFMLGGCSSDSHQHEAVPSSSDFPSPLVETSSSQPTARTLAPFKRLKYGMRAPAIVAVVGKADQVQDITFALYRLSDGSRVQLYYDAYLMGVIHTTKDGKVHTFIDDTQRHIVPTARTLAPFKQLKVGMYHMDIDALVGKADRDEGKELHLGIHNYCYKLSDGSLVWVGYAQDLTFVRHQLKSGKMVDLMPSK